MQLVGGNLEGIPMIDETAAELISEELTNAVELIRQSFTHILENRPRTAKVWLINSAQCLKNVRQFLNHEIGNQKPRGKNNEPGDDIQPVG